MTTFPSRRSVLGLVAAGTAAAVGIPGSAAAAWRRSPNVPGPELLDAGSALSRPDRVFIARGLMHGAWVRSEGGEWYPGAGLWKESGFNAPTFYLPSLWNGPLMQSLPENTPWAVARAPLATNLDPAKLPDPQAEWLTSPMLAAKDDLFTACFGDEEPYNDALTQWFAAAYARMHRDHPNVLVHNNQAVGQYNDTQMRTYLKTARPDLITFDQYYWQRARYWPGGSVTQLYNLNGRYRRHAVAGLDGDGVSPIAFGQYTCGFRLQPAEPIDGKDPKYLRRYFVSESQQHIVSFATWAFGGKWLDLFRWDLGAHDGEWESDGLFLTDENGKPRVQLNRYTELNTSLRALSPYLTRLRTRYVGLVNGKVGETGAATPASTEISAFAASGDGGSGLLSVVAKNVGTTNNGAPGDVLVGTFRALPGMSDAEAAGVLPDKANTPGFMLVNALAVANKDVYDPNSTGGSGDDTRQQLTVTVLPPAGKTNLYQVDRYNGALKSVGLSSSGTQKKFTVTAKGGQGELYLWA
ncbi:hypothetical protein [Streptomyces sp. NPDC050422]|uniref:hypothetical protein n=1 Tax=Streptomyces sp. NPDC050422 TaxID=3365614 RepID=UPI00379B2726